MKLSTAYVAHPLSGDLVGNVTRVRMWLRFLLEAEPDVAFGCPWLPYVEVLDDGVPAHRARGLRDCLAFVPKFDGIVLVGGKISSGMRLELDVAETAGLWVADLTNWGRFPPGTGLAEVSRAVGMLADGRARWERNKAFATGATEDAS